MIDVTAERRQKYRHTANQPIDRRRTGFRTSLALYQWKNCVRLPICANRAINNNKQMQTALLFLYVDDFNV